jgi:hypothetical protein
MADHTRLVAFQRERKVMDLSRRIQHVDLVRNRRVADAGQIRRDYREPFRELGNNRSPHPRSFRKPVQQNYHRRSVARGQVMQLHVVDLGVFHRDLFSGLNGAERDNGCYPKIN